MTPSNPLLSQCRRLFIKDFEILAQIGIHDFELKSPQRLLIDVDLYVDLKASSPSADQIDEVVDYDFIRQVVIKRVQQGHINLQETLCDELAGLLLANPQVLAVQLSTRKPDVYPDCSAVGVEIFRSRS
jgi:7,8-dihydroneopterin aldolase/epimerase/oxygenase